VDYQQRRNNDKLDLSVSRNESSVFRLKSRNLRRDNVGWGGELVTVRRDGEGGGGQNTGLKDVALPKLLGGLVEWSEVSQYG
jgi:hypothetical protein